MQTTSYASGVRFSVRAAGEPFGEVSRYAHFYSACSLGLCSLTQSLCEFTLLKLLNRGGLAYRCRWIKQTNLLVYLPPPPSIEAVIGLSLICRALRCNRSLARCLRGCVPLKCTLHRRVDLLKNPLINQFHYYSTGTTCQRRSTTRPGNESG